MVKAMAAHKDIQDKVDLQVQVAGPERAAADPADQRHGPAGRQGHRRLPDLAHRPQPGGQERLRQGRDDHRLRRRDHRALRLQRLRSTRRRPGGSPPSGWSTSSAARATSSRSPACPAPRSTRCAPRPRRRCSPSTPDIKIVAEANGMWSQAVARTELSKILATQSWDQIDGLWMQAGCFTANSMQLEAGKKPEELKPCAGEGSNGGRIQMLPAGTEVEGASSPYAPMGAPRISYASPPYSGGSGAEARRAEARGQGRPEADQAAAAARHQRHGQALRRRDLEGDGGGLQRVPAVAGLQPRAGSPRSTRRRRPRSGCRRRWSASPRIEVLNAGGPCPPACRQDARP